MKLFGMQKTRSFLLLFFSVISRYACIMTSCLTSKPRKPAKPQTTTCKRKGKANAKTLSPLKQQKKPKKRGRKKKQQSRCNRLRHTRYCRSSSNSSRHGTASRLHQHQLRLEALHLDIALLLALRGSDNSSSAHFRDHFADAGGVEGCVAEASADDVLGDGPEAGQDVEGAAVVAVEGAEEEGGFAVCGCVWLVRCACNQDRVRCKGRLLDLEAESRIPRSGNRWTGMQKGVWKTYHCSASCADFPVGK